MTGTQIHYIDKDNTNHILIASPCAAAHAARIEYPGGEEVCVPAGTILDRGSYVIEYYDSVEEAVSAMMALAYQWSQDQLIQYTMIADHLHQLAVSTVNNHDGSITYQHTWDPCDDAEYWLDNVAALRKGIDRDELTPGGSTQVLIHDGQFFLGGVARDNPYLITQVMLLVVDD